jgi:hypothetical protein
VRQGIGNSRRHGLATAVATACILTAGGSLSRSAVAQPPSPPVPTLLDPWQQAVVDSLAFPRRTTSSELLDAALRAADIEAFDVAIDYVAQLAATIDRAGDRKGEVLADLGDAFPAARLARLDRLLSSREPAVGRVMTAIRTTAGARHSREGADKGAAQAEVPQRGNGVEGERRGVDLVVRVGKIGGAADACNSASRD